MAQKIKYKDLYPLLEAQKYEDAEPFLKEFLKDPKNKEKNPNASYQLGAIYNQKALNNDILLETEAFQSNADSAILMYQQSLQLIDDRELKRNEEYYAAYKRRDIRSGKFGIKLGDIQFDIEGKIKSLEERKSKVKTLADYFYKAQNAYDTAQHLYTNLVNRYPSDKQLLLRIDEETFDLLDELKSSYAKALENFQSYKNVVSGVGNTSYNQKLVVKEIVDYPADGQSETDLTNNNVTFWDYSKWVDQVKNKHQEEVVPLFGRLISYDNELDKLNNKVSQDSVTVVGEITPIDAIPEFLKLKDFDPRPMPIVLFRYKVSMLEYKSHMLDWEKDSVDVNYQLKKLEPLVVKIREVDSLLVQTSELDLEEESENYAAFVSSQYKSVDGLRSYLSEQDSNIGKVLNDHMGTYMSVLESSRWLAAEGDSIPLFDIEDVSKSQYAPLLIDSLITAGIVMHEVDSGKGYLANITPSRQQDIKIVFELDSNFSKPDNYKNIESKSLVMSTDEENLYFTLFYSPLQEEEGFAATAARANQKGLSWVTNLKLAKKPDSLGYNIQTGEIIINYDVGNVSGAGGSLLGAKLTLSKEGAVVNQ
ncbi:hypothetical protein E1176_08585 [Fulvivirga sp. RKSG066]|nr:hypothetical protein [Fulvivirga aurantia]